MLADNQMELESNVDDLLYGISDNDVKETAKRCSEEGSLSSLIKLQLRTKIQLQKVEKYESCDVEWRQDNDISNQLTPEDLAKRQELKERNKLSARKHRIKKKQEKQLKDKEMEELSKRNAALKQQVEELESLKNKMFASFGIPPEENAA